MNVCSGFETKNPTFGKTYFNIICAMKLIKYIFVSFVLTISIKNMPGVTSIAMKLSGKTHFCSISL